MSERPPHIIRPFVLETERVFAPTSREEILELIDQVPIADYHYHVPTHDRHHHIFGADLSEAERLLRSHPDFITTIPRLAHMCIHKTFERSEPVSDDFVLGYALADPGRFSANSIRRLKQLRRRNG